MPRYLKKKPQKLQIIQPLPPMRLPGQPPLSLTNLKMTSPQGATQGARWWGQQHAQPRPTDALFLTGAERRAQAALTSSCSHSRRGEEPHFHQEHPGDSFLWSTIRPRTQQCLLHNRVWDLQLPLLTLMFKSRVILIYIIWCLSSDYTDTKGLLFRSNVYSAWAKQWPSRPPVTHSLCSPRPTIPDGEFVDSIFSSEKDGTSQDPVEKTLAG